MNYTRHSERHDWALFKRSYQAAYYSAFHITVLLGALWRGFGGVGAVFNARGLVCGWVNRARQFTPLARVVFLESKRAKTHITQVWISSARCKHARVAGLGEGRGSTWPLGTHHLDGGAWNAWVCACANHTRPTRGTRRELGSEVSRNKIGKHISTNPAQIVSGGEPTWMGVAWHCGSACNAGIIRK
jgi:hypothetical protein